jgi:plasmid stability protein
MTSLTIRNISDNTKARLKIQAKARGRSLEAYVRGLLEQAADTLPAPDQKTFPDDLIALVAPGEDIEPYIEKQDQKQPLIEL